MADEEKQAASSVLPQGMSTQENVPESHVQLPEGVKYKPWKFGPLRAPYYCSPKAQLLIVSFVCFLCPGMFNALGGMGGGGQLDTTTADAANAALYGVFAVVGFFAGSVVNVIGIKPALAFGGLGYSLYIAGFLSYNYDSNRGFAIFAGAVLGGCAGLLWTAQGAIMMSYPKERSKGRYISWFWIIFNFGGVIGGLIPLGTNINREKAASVSNGTYIGFLVLTFVGACLAFTIAPTKSIVRTDGSTIILMKQPTWKSEFLGMFQTLRSDIWIVLMFPMFFASNWFYTYQFNGVNAAYFTVRTRALNSILYWMMQIIGAAIFGYALDLPQLSRPFKAKACWGALFCLTFAIWGGGYAFETRFTRAQASATDFVATDWSTSGYVGPMFLYMFYGMYDACWQTSVYWFMGSLSNNARKLANFAGFYKGIQSAGACIAFGADAGKIPYLNEFASCWALLAGSLVIASPLIFTKIRDHVPIEEDLKFSDETFEEVAPQAQRSGSVDKH